MSGPFGLRLGNKFGWWMNYSTSGMAPTIRSSRCVPMMETFTFCVEKDPRRKEPGLWSHSGPGIHQESAFQICELQATPIQNPNYGDQQ
jgi:hypothetical protein